MSTEREIMIYTRFSYEDIDFLVNKTKNFVKSCPRDRFERFDTNSQYHRDQRELGNSWCRVRVESDHGPVPLCLCVYV